MEDKKDNIEGSDLMSEFMQGMVKSITTQSQAVLQKALLRNQQLKDELDQLRAEAEAKDQRLEEQNVELQKMDELRAQNAQLKAEKEKLQTEKEGLQAQVQEMKDFMHDTKQLVMIASTGFLVLLREKFNETFRKLSVENRMVVKEVVTKSTPDELPQQKLALSDLDSLMANDDGRKAQLNFEEGSNTLIQIS